MKRFISLFLSVFLVVAVFQFVSAQTTSTENLGLNKPVLLPTSPLYFLKEWSRGIQLFFTLGSINKANRELKFANDIASEIKTLEEKADSDSKGIEKAIANYNDNMERLRERLTSLKETSQNPNVDALLNDLTERAIVHQELFSGLKARKTELKDEIASTQDKINKVLADGLENLDEPDKAAQRLEKVIAELPDKNLQEIIGVKTIVGIAPDVNGDALRERLINLEEKFSSKLEGKIQAGAITVQGLGELIDDLAGPAESKIKVLDSLRQNVSDETVKNQLNSIRNSVFDEVEKSDSVDENKATSTINELESVIQQAEAVLNAATSGISQSARVLMERAKFNLEQAKESYNAGDFGRAFGQAVSAEVMAKNALRQSSESGDETKNDLDEFKQDFDELKAKAKEKGLTEQNSPDLYNLFSQAENKIAQLLNLAAKSNASQDSITQLKKEVQTLLAAIESNVEE